MKNSKLETRNSKQFPRKYILQHVLVISNFVLRYSNFACSRKIAIVIVLLILTASIPARAFAGPNSTNYELESYGFGAGGESMSSTNYKADGTVGEVEFGQLSSTNYKVNSGLTFTTLANVPPAPTFTNPGDNYDRLKIIINTGNNPSDAEYAVAISTDNFVSNTQYVQSDFTIGSSFGDSNFIPYSTWGSGSGVFISGLSSSTTYYVKVKARKGDYTETAYGPAASAGTSLPSLTFGLDAATLTFTHLNSSNSYTDSSKTSVLTTSTNAYNGYVINARVTDPLTYGDDTIANYASSNASPTTWSGNGFGYTTNDNNLAGGTVDRFTNGGPKYAGFTTSSPGDPVADHAGPVTSSISNEQFTISYRVTSPSINPAGDYTTTVLYIVVPTY